MPITSPPFSIRDKLPRSGTTIFTVMSRLAQEVGAINLSQGFPDFPIDPVLIELVANAMREGRNQYAPMAGLPALRDAIVAKVDRVYGVDHDPDEEVTVTAGATQALFTALAALVHPGDEVIIMDPSYDCYAPSVSAMGGTAVHVPMDDELRFDASLVAKAITKRTRVLMINSPHNPGGTVLRRTELNRIAEMLKGTDIVLISDEVYEHLVFDGLSHASVLSIPDLRERSFVVFSFGKVFHATGWKVGYILAPTALMALFRKIHQFNVFSVNTPMQHALAEYLQQPSNYDGLPAFFQSKRDRFAAGLKGSRFELLPCEGSYFQVVDFAGISEQDDMTFAQELARVHGVAAIPLTPFYASPPHEQRFLRFCFAKEDATLDAAIERLCAI